MEFYDDVPHGTIIYKILTEYAPPVHILRFKMPHGALNFEQIYSVKNITENLILVK